VARTVTEKVRSLYPRLPADDDEEDGFHYYDTPTKPKSALKHAAADEEDYEWEVSEDDVRGLKQNASTGSLKRPRFDLDFDSDIMRAIEMSSPPESPVVKKRALADPFTTPPKQISSTPHTPPDTHPSKKSPPNLFPLSQSLLLQLAPHAPSLGPTLWATLREHLMRCGRVADGATRGRDAARVEITNKDTRIKELEKRVSWLETQRKADRAMIESLNTSISDLIEKKG
jgi:hypothetical protein